ncbi:Uncharacterised protein [Actinobaculum suis]|uniref:Uncharacterized protein n=1 Tax=Actinobaculum suis TaxID=1657 RepID=A0A7Z8YB29_9ACTO|nr:Uncharacterised protein [Actinobaculum suis]
MRREGHTTFLEHKRWALASAKVTLCALPTRTPGYPSLGVVPVSQSAVEQQFASCRAPNLLLFSENRPISDSAGIRRNHRYSAMWLLLSENRVDHRGRIGLAAVYAFPNRPVGEEDKHSRHGHHHDGTTRPHLMVVGEGDTRHRVDHAEEYRQQRGIPVATRNQQRRLPPAAP